MTRAAKWGVPLLIAFVVAGTAAAQTGEDWPQFKFDARHSGNVPGRSVATPLRLVGAVPLTDAAFTSPVVMDGRVYVVDGSGVAFCIDAASHLIVNAVSCLPPTQSLEAQ